MAFNFNVQVFSIPFLYRRYLVKGENYIRILLNPEYHVLNINCWYFFSKIKTNKLDKKWIALLSIIRQFHALNLPECKEYLAFKKIKRWKKTPFFLIISL